MAIFINPRQRALRSRSPERFTMRRARGFRPDTDFHVGSTATGSLLIANSASVNYSEALVAALISATATSPPHPRRQPISPRGTIGVIPYSVSTAQSGTVGGTLQLQFSTDGTGIDNAGLTGSAPRRPASSRQSTNYATDAIVASAGQLTFDGTNYVLNLGTVLQDSQVVPDGDFVRRQQRLRAGRFVERDADPAKRKWLHQHGGWHRVRHRRRRVRGWWRSCRCRSPTKVPSPRCLF